MEEFNIQLHRFHIDKYFERLGETIDSIKSVNEKISYIDFHIGIEERRLNRYFLQLQPNLYTDHKIYVNELKDLIETLKGVKSSYINEYSNDVIFTFKWNLDEAKIKTLYDKLSNVFISPETGIETFKNLFLNKELRKIDKKIIWLKYSKNKHINKKSIADFIDVLLVKNVILNENADIKANYLKILSSLFTSQKSDLNFTNSNLSKDGDYSEFRADLEKIIDDII